MADAVPQHKRLAMGKPIGVSSRKANFATGGKVALLKSGIPESPITKAKAANGVPGMKKGGKC